ncbi:DAK2 domain-containing protein [Fusibacillus kribbianus]|uniref:DAK2 domain-containing protein n=1 Tax=Fusibacillus kribbianus TaxID=3044208 RepID=A0AAP4BAD9_9FIRM|nr:DAK2 domain-containing protein [Ruminococcus sp. YH-rum2234]MDI9241218.1 DAK2 domain-containing protein [Ruminococcus sp. YH-rum2234]
MAVNVIDAALLKTMFLAGAQGLESKKEWINELNVFPVPDGDTGTNMTLTIMSAAKEVQALTDPTMETLAKAISSGSLRGARGNSGVILSQLFRGLTKEIKTVDVIDTRILAKAFQRATETAYKAVMKPKEGTILTVAKGMADKAAELSEETEDMEAFLRAVIEYGDLILSQTPEMLPVLKQAGVVDSGGQGLMQVMKGAFDGFLGKEISLDAGAPAAFAGAVKAEADDFDIKFGYCTEFIINLEKEYNEKTEQDFKAFLESIGDSIVLVSDDDLVKVHVHTNDPGLAIQRALTYGSLSRMKIDNMREEHQEKLIKDAAKLAAEQAKKKTEPRKAVGFIAVSIGEGLGEIFKGLNVDYLIEGGQTMNPSTEDMLNAIDQVNADTIYIFPNNKNIILAAEQAVHLCEDKEIVVIPSKTVPQGITAIINFIPELSPEENKAAMIEEMSRVKTGQVTYAVRDTSMDGFEIKEGDIMGIGDKAILAEGKEIGETSLQLLEAMVDEDTELVTIYYGSDVAEEDAEALLAKAEEQHPDVDIELHFGGQPIYYYIISAE